MGRTPRLAGRLIELEPGRPPGWMGLSTEEQMPHTYTVSIAALLERRFRWSRNDTLLVSDGQRLTGRDLDSLTARAAAAYREMGIRPRDVVCLVGDNTARFYIAYLAVHRIGAVACALHARESEQRISTAMEHVGCRLVITDAGHHALVARANALRSAPAPIVYLDDGNVPSGAVGFSSFLSKAPVPLNLPAVSPEDPATILLSSGSTGTPKAVRHSQRALINHWGNAQYVYGALNAHTRMLQMVGTSFAAWCYTGMPVLHAGGTVVTCSRFDPEEFCRLVQVEAVNLVAGVPTMFRLIDDSISRRYDLSSIRTVGISGEVVQERDLDQIRAWSPQARLQVFYQTSEIGSTAATICAHEDMLERGKLGSVGRPVPNADLRIVDPEGSIDDVVAAGEIGEIVVTGPTLADAYLGDEARTAAKFVDGWWRSGDLGRLDEDGFLYFEGRADNAINTGGIKIYGEEIEEALMSHPLVRQAAVIGVPDAKWGNAVTAFVVTNDTVGEAELLLHCEAQGLASFKRPKRIHLRDQLPVGPTGKLDRGSLRRELSEGPEAAHPHGHPASSRA